tara:strand:+ start:4512 stop:5240 length:729 start_codon:yes stop_codon:yes gene_type:complete
MSFEPNPSNVEIQSPSGQELFELPAGLGTNTKILSRPLIILKTLGKTPADKKYINSFIPLWSEAAREESIPDDRLFLISKEHIELDDGSFMYDYTSIEEQEITIETTGVEGDLSTASATILYGPKEVQRLVSLYGVVTPQLQVTLDEDPSGATAITTNSVKGDGLTFNSLSSLGPISQETLTLSVTSDSEGTAIEQREAVVTDVGGVTTANVRESLKVDGDLKVRATSAGITSGTTTITSGY